MTVAQTMWVLEIVPTTLDILVLIQMPMTPSQFHPNSRLLKKRLQNIQNTFCRAIFAYSSRNILIMTLLLQFRLSEVPSKRFPFSFSAIKPNPITNLALGIKLFCTKSLAKNFINFNYITVWKIQNIFFDFSMTLLLLDNLNCYLIHSQYWTTNKNIPHYDHLFKYERLQISH